MNLAEKLEEIHRLAHRHWMKTGGELGLSYSEFEYLSAIKEQELAAVNDRRVQHLRDIVRVMGVNKASASAMMDKLEKRKLVRVKPCKWDARAKIYVLSKKGDELRQQGKRAYDALLASEAERISQLLETQTLVEPKESVAEEKQPTTSTTPKKKRVKKEKAEPEKSGEQQAQLPQLSLFG